ncbi:S13-like H2TH domain-containing protein [Jaminaea rosea]|uniref:S13-like H2TH domain-containing protein n=1 Tax=Jaminaea rosea TaxID=1569628 RepID=A0A316UY20_9BASI|nr:S13-like H2TH domain-containing protein [Jaminaea rosea]PWN30199.1 S13-like H2TH domain-containing protein [Jaminaea rosea]
MFLLGHQMPDNQKVKAALTVFYGLSTALSSRLCARLQVHDSCRVGDLTEAQTTQLSAYLSSPGSIPARPSSPTRGPLTSSSEASSSSNVWRPSQAADPSADPLRSLVVDSELRRALRANIAHHRAVGTYRGKRHQQGLPVRGQRTSTNAMTAKKLNRIERRGMATTAGDGAREAVRSQETMSVREMLPPSPWSRGSAASSPSALFRSSWRPSIA